MSMLRIIDRRFIKGELKQANAIWHFLCSMVPCYTCLPSPCSYTIPSKISNSRVINQYFLFSFFNKNVLLRILFVSIILYTFIVYVVCKIINFFFCINFEIRTCDDIHNVTYFTVLTYWLWIMLLQLKYKASSQNFYNIFKIFRKHFYKIFYFF